MIRKSVIAGLSLALLLAGGGYFSSIDHDAAVGVSYAATSMPNTSPQSSRRGPTQQARTQRQSSYGSVNVMSVSESTMQSKMTNTSRYAVNVGTSSPYTEYWSTASNSDDAAKAILHRVSSGYFQTSNARLYNSMLRYGSFSTVKTYSNHGSTVYCFRR